MRELTAKSDEIAKAGGTPLAVAKDGRLLGVIHLKDIVKGGIRERFAELRRMGIRTVMITGDNPLTAAAIAAESGVDDFLAQATPETKLKLIRDEQAQGKLVAMCGDGTNDAPALAQADVGVAMNTGTMAAREAGNMVDLDSDPTKLIEIVEIGKQLLMTRGALTTFSIANDVAKYFAMIPAMFVAFYPQLQALNVMRLHNSAERDPVGDHLQRADHRRADPAGAARRRLPADRRRGDPAAQPADLRPRRHRRAVRRHQADRHARHRHRPGLRTYDHETHSPRHRDDRRDDDHHRPGLSAGMTGIAQVAVPVPGERQPDRRKDGKVIGSALIGQNFTVGQVFPRPPVGDDGAGSEGPEQDDRRALRRGQLGGSNLGPTSKALVDRVKADAAMLAKENPGTPIPVDLVTTSASGLDPDITPAGALFQVPRVAKARGLPEDQVRALVEDHITGRLLGVIGEPHVNVLKLNLALDAMK